MSSTTTTCPRICPLLLIAMLAFGGCARSVDTHAPVSAVEQQELEDQLQMLEKQSQAKVSVKR